MQRGRYRWMLVVGKRDGMGGTYRKDKDDCMALLERRVERGVERVWLFMTLCGGELRCGWV